MFRSVVLHAGSSIHRKSAMLEYEVALILFGLYVK
jgi:hypothetical protein